MRRISLVVTDVDGTLVTPDKKLTPRALEAVARLHAHRIPFSICSSRPPFGLRTIIGPLHLALPFGGYNGGAIVEPDLTIVEQVLIPPDVARQTVAMFQEHGIDCWLFVGSEWLCTNPAGDKVELETYTVQQPPTIVPEFTDRHFASVGKIVGPSENHDRLAQLTELMQQALSGRATVARSQPYYCDVIPPGIDKGHLVELLAGRLGGIPRDEIMVLGDMDNDLEMFRRAGFGVAMGNASEAVKRAADAVTLSNGEDGFAAAIDRYVFGE